MLAVVGRRARVALPFRQGLHRPAERRPRLEEADVVALLRELERRREPGEPTADDRDPHSATTAFIFSTVERLGRLAEDVVAAGPHLHEEAAIDPREAAHAERAAPVEEREELEALAHERVRADRLVLHQRAPAGAGTTGGDLLLAHPEPAQLVLREIHAPERPVLGDVSHDVDLLQREAERLRAGPRRLPARRLVHGRARDSDGPCDPPAVLAQLVPGRVAVLVAVHERTVDEVDERLGRNGIAAHRVRERDEDRVAVLRGGKRADGGPPRLELGPGGLLLVGEVVDAARKCVERGDRPALRARKDADPPGEVPRGLARDPVRLGVGLLGVHRRKSSRKTRPAKVHLVGAGRLVNTSHPARSSASRAARPPRA